MGGKLQEIVIGYQINQLDLGVGLMVLLSLVALHVNYAKNGDHILSIPSEICISKETTLFC